MRAGGRLVSKVMTGRPLAAFQRYADQYTVHCTVQWTDPCTAHSTQQKADALQKKINKIKLAQHFVSEKQSPPFLM